MASGGGIDIKALNWVKTEIGEALNQIRQALETYVETPDSAKLDFIAANLHQITGTLHIVELFGPALLAEEMEHLAQALKAEQVKQKQDAYEVLTRGILQLPAYLEHLSHGHQDRPVLLLALLNDLRAARGLPLLSENALFTPDLNVLPPPKTTPMGATDVRALTKKLRSAYQAALVGVLRGNDVPAQAKKLGVVLAQLDGASHSATVRQLWWVARGVVEALAERGLDTSVAVKMLLGQLDRQLKTMVDQGEAALQKTPSKDLVKNLLFYVAQASSKGARVSELKTAFNLDQLLPSAGALSQAQDELLGVNAGVMDHVAAALKEDLLSIKETVDLFVRTKDRPLSELEPVIVKLRTVADTLGMLGLGRLRQPVTEQENALKNVLDGTQALTDDVIMGVAGALLFVESSLGDLHTVTSGGSGAETSGIASNADLPEAEYRSLVGLTTQEARAVLGRVKDAVLQFAAQPTAFELLQPSAESINDIKGAMLILGYDQAADLMGLAGQFLVTELLEKRSALSAQKLDTLADVIAGLEYFLESAADDPVGARSGLNTVRESLALLGYGTKPVPEIKAPEPDIKVTPASEPVVAVAPPAPLPATTPAAPVDDPPPVDPEVLEIFLEEAGEECVNVATQLELWKKNAADDNALRTLRRSFHTVKGSGRIVGAMEIGEFAWAVENMLNRVLDRTIEVSPAVYGVLEQARDLMPLLVEELRAGTKGGVVTHPLIERAQRVAKGELLDDLAPLPLPVPELVEAAEDVILDAEAAPPPGRQVDPVLAEIFVNETRNHLAAVSAFIEHCAAPDVHCTISEDLIRALHTLHGSARMADIEEIADVADALEKWAKLVAENHSPVDVEVLATLRNGYAFINDVLGDLSDTHTTHAAKLLLLEHIAEAHRVAAERQQQRLQTEPTNSLEAERVETAPAVKPDDDVDIELVNVFLLEATDLVGRSVAEANVWIEVPQRDEYLDEIRRRFSTLHGGARIANLIPIATACSAANALLAQLQENPALRSAEAVRLILRVLAWVDEALTSTRDQRPLSTPSELLDQLENYSAHAPPPVVAESTVDVSNIDPDAELRGVFLDEAVDILQSLDEVMGSWRSSLNDLAILSEVQRGLHTIKGGANMARIAPVGELCHQVETLLQRIGEGLLPANSAAFDAVQAAHDWLSRSVESLRQGENIAQPDELLRQIDAVMTTPRAPVAGVEPEPEILPEIKTQPEARADERQVIPFPRSTEPVLSEAADSDSDLLDVFLEEANEILATMDDLITRWATDTTNAEVVGELQRALHTIKGGARMAKVAPIGDLSHSIENIFEGIAQGRVKTNSALVDVMHTAYDWLGSALERVRDKVALDSAAPLIHQIEVAVGLRKASAKSVGEAWAPTENSAGIAALMDAARTAAVPGATDMEQPAPAQKAKVVDEQVRVALGLLDELVNNAGEMSIYRSRIELQLNSVNFNLLELAQTVNRLREQLRKFEIEAEAQMLFRYEKSGVSDSEEFDPLELDRFSNMQQLSRSLVESVGDLGSIQKLLDNLTRESEILLLQQSRVGSALQDGLMRTRLVPFSSVVPRLRRIVRQTAKELDKQIELHVLGAEGEMDRSVLNRLTPALEHMLRNAVDHGIEAPSARGKSGKADGGNITLKFWREGPEIVLSIADDGAGMDLAAIRKKAVERGLMEKNSDLTDNEVTQFVLEAGFSTAKKVTQISGRGVGMDVVNNQIKQLNGTLQISTTKGQGSTFIIRLPLTVSVNQALMVHVGEQTYAIPLMVIDGVVRAGREELEKLQRDEHLRYEYGGHSYKFFHLGTVLNISQPQLPDAGVKIPLILARAGDHRVALHVEAIVARQEVVIKSVGPQVATVIGISGATIMNDGGVALILDLSSLIRAGIAHTKRDHGAAPVAAKISNIMIVDDSITVRKVTERFLTRNGFETVTAKDGVDALAKLQEYLPDVMLLDIEMPRMDGYELATAMRNDARLKNIPIIMITSRTGEKHRERAMAIGVNMYMGKPYQDKELLENINTLLRTRGH